ncbi:V8-like Glu-specific endopeptidase [Sphingomonas sp. F9_3S_D5_B_2]
MRTIGKICTAVATSITALTASPHASAGLVFGQDDREVVASSPGSVFAPIGIVYGTPEASYATAFLVDNCYAVTVQHVFGQRGAALGRPIVFAAGVAGPSSQWRISRAKVVAEGGLERFATSADPYGRRTADWALLRLSKCLGREFGHAQLTADVPDAAGSIAMAGYPTDKPLAGGLVLDRSCRIREKRAGVLLHDCSALHGNSGSPLFRIVSNGKHRLLEVVAMHTAGHSFSGPGADLVLPVREYVSTYSNVAVSLCDPNDPRGGAASKLPCHSHP